MRATGIRAASGFLHAQRKTEAPGPDVTGSTLVTRTYPTARSCPSGACSFVWFGVPTIHREPRGGSPSLAQPPWPSCRPFANDCAPPPFSSCLWASERPFRLGGSRDGRHPGRAEGESAGNYHVAHVRPQLPTDRTTARAGVGRCATAAWCASRSRCCPRTFTSILWSAGGRTTWSSLLRSGAGGLG